MCGIVLCHIYDCVYTQRGEDERVVQVANRAQIATFDICTLLQTIAPSQLNHNRPCLLSNKVGVGVRSLDLVRHGLGRLYWKRAHDGRLRESYKIGSNTKTSRITG